MHDGPGNAQHGGPAHTHQDFSICWSPFPRGESPGALLSHWSGGPLGSYVHPALRDPLRPQHFESSGGRTHHSLSCSKGFQLLTTPASSPLPPSTHLAMDTTLLGTSQGLSCLKVLHLELLPLLFPELSRLTFQDPAQMCISGGPSQGQAPPCRCFVFPSSNGKSPAHSSALPISLQQDAGWQGVGLCLGAGPPGFLISAPGNSTNYLVGNHSHPRK